MDNKCIRRRGQQNNILQMVSEAERNTLNNFEGNPYFFLENEREDAQQANIKRLNQEENNTKRLNREENNEKMENPEKEQDKQGAWNALLKIAEKLQFCEQVDKVRLIRQKAKVLRQNMRDVEDVQAYWDYGKGEISEKVVVLRLTMNKKGSFPKSVTKFLKGNPNSFAKMVNSVQNISGKACILSKAKTIAQVEAYWNDPSVEGAEKVAVLRESVKGQGFFSKAVTEFLQNNLNSFVKMVCSAQNISDKACILSKAKTIAQVEAYWSDPSVEVLEKATVLRETMNEDGSFPKLVTEFLQSNPNNFAKMVHSVQNISDKAYILSKAKTIAQVEAYWNDPSVEASEKTAVSRKIMNEDGSFPKVITGFLKDNPHSFIKMISSVRNISGKACILCKANAAAQVEAYWNDPSIEASEKVAVLRETVNEDGAFSRAVTEFLKDDQNSLVELLKTERRIWVKARMLALIKTVALLQKYWSDETESVSEKVEALEIQMESNSIPNVVIEFLKTNPNIFVQMLHKLAPMQKIEILKKVPAKELVEAYWDETSIEASEKAVVLAKAMIRSKYVENGLAGFFKDNQKVFAQVVDAAEYPEKIEILARVNKAELVAAYWDDTRAEASEKVKMLAKATIRSAYGDNGLRRFLKDNLEAFAQVVDAAEYLEKVEILAHTNKATQVRAYWYCGTGEASEKAGILAKAIITKRQTPNAIEKFLKDNLEVFVQVVDTTNNIDDKAKILEIATHNGVRTYWNNSSEETSVKAKVLAKTISRTECVNNSVSEFLKGNQEVFVQVVDAAAYSEKVEILARTNKTTQVQSYWHYGTGETSEKATVLAKAMIRGKYLGNDLSGFFRGNLAVFVQAVNAAVYAEKVEILAHTNKAQQVMAYWCCGTGGVLEKADVLAKAILTKGHVSNAIGKFLKDNPEAFVQVVHAINSRRM